MNSPYAFSIRLFTLLLDALLINVSFFLTYQFLGHYSGFHIEHGFFKALFAYNILWFLISFAMRLYGSYITHLEEVFRRTWRSLALHFVMFLAFLYGTKNNLPNAFCFSFLLLNCVLFLFSRFALTYTFELLHKKIQTGKKIAIVGYNETAEKLADYFDRQKGDYIFEGFFDDELCLLKPYSQSLSVVGSIENCVKYATEHQVDEIYSTILPRQNQKIEVLMRKAEANCIRVKFVPDFSHDMYDSFYLQQVGRFPVITLRKEPLELLNNRLKKRLFDIVISSLVIVFVLSWLTPLLAICIKLTSRGPVFFKQKRSGKENHSFWCYKFRSMRVNTESDLQQATKDDDRITKIGAFIRKTSIDEFPQFFNVLIGNMSLVGPRPHMLKHTEQYSSSIDKYMVRHFLKPGITGWAQVNGYRGETETDELMRKRVEHDLWYLENWSLMLDVRIFFMTIIEVLKPNKKAY